MSPQKTRKVRNQSIAVAVFQTDLVRGEAVAKPIKQGVKLYAKFFKLPPGNHGFHIHTAGDLRGEGCKGACAHYHKGAPSHHGDAPGTSKRARHTGDLGNIHMDSSQESMERTYTLSGVQVSDLWGRSLIVHADEDDLGLGDHEDSKTTGHSGDRIACAIFGRSQERC